nr:Ca(2+)-dependent cysteine protease [Polyrhizophydium stewartii]
MATQYAPPPGPPPPQQFAPPARIPSQPVVQMSQPMYGQWQAPDGYFQQYSGYFSSCTGRKRALLIGVNYFNTESELRGCINDVQNMRQFLTRGWGFSEGPDNMVVLTDDQPNQFFQPTRYNILEAMKWLVRGAQPGDSLFLHFSGHGGQTEDLDGDESDGYDETIYPVDHKTAGVIVDDEMNAILVRGLPHGVRLTAVFDCCHSGSALDLPFMYLPDGRLKQSSKMGKLGGIAKNSAMQYAQGNVVGAISGIMSGFKQLTRPEKTLDEKVAEKGSVVADVVMFSGCKDSQTSADTQIGGTATGAMSHALVKALTQTPRITYGALLQSVRNILAEEYSQIPQLTTARYMDMNQAFIM